MALVAVVMATAAGALSAQVPADSGASGGSGRPGMVTVLSGAALRAAGIQTLADALREAPGLDVVASGAFDGGTVALGGLGGGPTGVLVRWNGIPLDIGASWADLANLTLDGVDRIEVRRGAAADLGGVGSATTVVDVSTFPSRSADRGAVEAAWGQDATVLGRGEGATGGPGWQVSAAASGLSSDGGVAARESLRGGAASTSLSVGEMRASYLKLGAYVSRTSYGFFGADIGLAPDPAALVTLDQAQRATTSTLSLEAGTTLGGRLALGVLVGRHDDGLRYHAVPTDTAFYPADWQSIRRAVAHRTHYAVSAGYRLAPWIVASVAVEQDESEATDADSTLVGGPLSWNERGVEDRTTGVVAGIAGDGEGEPWSFAAQVRRDVPKGGPRVTTWRALLARRIGGATWVHAGVRSGFRVRSDSEFIFMYPTATDERDRTLELGVRQTFARGRASVAATVIDQRFDDYIALAPIGVGTTGDLYAGVNIGSARSRGWEVSAELHPVRALSIAATWSHLPTKAVSLASPSPFIDLSFVAGEALLDRAADLVVASATLRARRGATVAVQLRSQGRRAARYLDSTAGSVYPDLVPAYAVLDLGGRVPLTPWMQVTLRAANLLDARYAERVGYPARGRSLSLGARLSAP